MNNLRTLIFLLAGLNCNSIFAQEGSHAPDSPPGSIIFDEPATLDDVVEQFNMLADANAIGKQQSALTSEEIIGAIRRWANNSEMDAAIKKKFEKIVETGKLPTESEIRFDTILFSEDYRFNVWSIDLAIDGFRFRIRDRTISSRVLTLEEKQDFKVLDAMTKRLGSGHPKIIELHRKLELDRDD